LYHENDENFFFPYTYILPYFNELIRVIYLQTLTT